MDYILQIFKAVANDRRLDILGLLLKGGELTIEKIASTLKIPETTVCRNLKILERTYIVLSRRKDGNVLYRLNRPNDHAYNKILFKLIKKRKPRRESRQ